MNKKVSVIVYNTIFLFTSLIFSSVVVLVLPVGDPEPGTLPRAILVISFFLTYTLLLTIYWYNKTYLPAQTDDTD